MDKTQKIRKLCDEIDEIIKPSNIPSYLSDEQAERIGAVIAADFELKPSREYKGGWETATGWFSNKGIARRAHRHIVEGLTE